MDTLKMLEGLKTLILAGLGLGYAALSSWGIVIPQDDQTAISAAIYSVLVIVLRHYTTGKVWYLQPDPKPPAARKPTMKNPRQK